MAASVSFSGLGSGIDFSKLTDSIVATRSRPISLLQAKSSDITRKSDAFKQLNAKLATLTEAANALTKQDLGTGRLASSSATDKLTVSASATAGTGTLNVTITRLATSLTQNSRAYTASTEAVLAGGATTATFELRKGGATSGTAITINSANNTLTGLRDAINTANAGVTATIVDTSGSGSYKLVLNSNDTGTAGRVQLVETTSTGTGTDLALASLNPPGATNDFSDLDATLTVNGLALTRSSNTISDAVEGLTLNLKAAGTATVSVAVASSEIETKLRSFIAAYNDVQDFFAAQYVRGSNGRFSGALAGEVTARSIQQQLRDVVGGSSTTNGGALDNLTQLGIGREENGKLKLDGTVLTDKLTNSLSDVKALLAGKTSTDTGLANQLYDTYKLLSDSTTGVIQNIISGYQTSQKTLDNSITDQLRRISELKSSLTRQFAVADAAISKLNNQNTALTNILTSYNNSQSNKR